MPPNLCIHHWLITPPAGPTSYGDCKLCGEEREFVNAEDKYRKPSLQEMQVVRAVKRQEGRLAEIEWESKGSRTAGR